MEKLLRPKSAPPNRRGMGIAPERRQDSQPRSPGFTPDAAHSPGRL